MSWRLTLGQQLRAELAPTGLLLSKTRFEACRARAITEGTAAMRDVEALLGVRTWQRALEPLHGDAATVYRFVMGYGGLMTRFIIAPVPDLVASRDDFQRAGALANLLVGYVDELVDHGMRRSAILPPWALRQALAGGRALPIRAWSRTGPAPARLVCALVIAYARHVARLPYATRHPEVRARLDRTIYEMYEAEAKSPREWSLSAGTSRQRKTAFPIVVLGLPAWLAVADADPRTRSWHLRWLQRMGKFIRWIDDVADVEQDARDGAPNLLLDAMRALDDRNDRDDAIRSARLVSIIARRGGQLLADWEQAVPPSRQIDAERDSFPAIVTAWLGGPADEAPSSP